MFRRISFITLALAILAVQPLLSLPASAATQTQSVSLTPIPADSELVTNANLGIYLEPASATQTQVSPENEVHMYGWTFNPYSFLPCEQALPLKVHLRAMSSLDSEGGQSWSVLILARYSGNTATPLSPELPVIEGYSPEDSSIFVGRWSVGAEGIPVGEATGTAGAMEAIWDISSLGSSDQLSLAIENRADEGTVGLMTTIQFAQVSYDTTACSPEVPATLDQPLPSSPKTGIATSLAVGISAILASLFLVLQTAKRLKAKH